MSDVRDVMLQRLWAAYDHTASNRQKSLLWLGTMLGVYSVLWINRDETAKLPFLEVPVPLVVAFALLPGLVAVFASQFWMTSAHGLRAYMAFMEQFWMRYGDELTKMGISYTDIHASFKRRDVTENLCPFVVPIRPTREWSRFLPYRLAVMSNSLASIISLFLVIVPLGVYVVSLMYLLRSEDFWSSFPAPWLLIAMYLMVLPLFVAIPPYLFLRVGPARMQYQAMIGAGSRHLPAGTTALTAGERKKSPKAVSPHPPPAQRDEK